MQPWVSSPNFPPGIVYWNLWWRRRCMAKVQGSDTLVRTDLHHVASKQVMHGKAQSAVRHKLEQTCTCRIETSGFAHTCVREAANVVHGYNSVDFTCHVRPCTEACSSNKVWHKRGVGEGKLLQRTLQRCCIGHTAAVGTPPDGSPIQLLYGGGTVCATALQQLQL